MRFNPFLALIIVFNVFTSNAYSQKITLAYDTGEGPVAFAANKFHQALTEEGGSLTSYHINQLSDLPDISVVIKDNMPEWISPLVGQHDFDSLRSCSRWLPSTEGWALHFSSF